MSTGNDMPVLHEGWQPGRDVSDVPRSPRRPRRLWVVPAVFLVLGVTLGVGAVTTALDERPVRTDPQPVVPALEPARPPVAAPPPRAAPDPGIPEWDRGGPQRFPQTVPTPVRPAEVAGPSVTGRECDIDDLSVVAHGWSRWMPQNGSVVLTATNRADSECLLAGWPTLRLEQDDVLGLEMAQVSRDRTGREAPPRRLVLEPGHSASSVLTWRGYGAASDQQTAQRLTVRLGAGERREVTVAGEEQGAAPFDLVDGGEIEVASWQPSSPEPTGDG